MVATVGEAERAAVGAGEGATIATAKSATETLAIAALFALAAALTIADVRDPSLIAVASDARTAFVRSAADATPSSAAAAATLSTSESVADAPASCRCLWSPSTRFPRFACSARRAASAHAVSPNCDVSYPSVAERPAMNAPSAPESKSLQRVHTFVYAGCPRNARRRPTGRA